jgi:hypothetical protein
MSARHNSDVTPHVHVMQFVTAFGQIISKRNPKGFADRLIQTPWRKL